MELTRKYLKYSSLVILAFAALTLINMVTQLLFGDLNGAEIPEGAPENILLITKIVLAVVTLLLLLPQVYVGIKGLKIAKNPNSSRGHIVWAKILFVLAVLGLISPLVNIFNGGDVWDNVSTLSSVLVEAITYFEFIRYSTQISRAI